MNYIKITENKNNLVKGNLTNDKGSFSIPVKFSNNGLAHFRNNKVEINPDLINIIKDNKVISSMTDVKISEMFGKSIIEGTNADDGHSNVMISTEEIKQMWTETYDYKCDVWNIEI